MFCVVSLGEEDARVSCLTLTRPWKRTLSLFPRFIQIFVNLNKQMHALFIPVPARR